ASLLAAHAERHPADAERVHAGGTAPQAGRRRQLLRVDRARARALCRAPRGEADGDRRLPDGVVDTVARAAARRIASAMVEPRAGEPPPARGAEPPGPGWPGRDRRRADRVRVYEPALRAVRRDGRPPGR